MKKEKKNKGVIIIVILLILALLIGAAYKFFVADKKDNDTKETTKKEEKKEKETKEETITITFDVDGGKEVKELTVNIDEEVELPTTEKEGYTFKGWYLEDEKMDAKASFKEDTTLKAKWEKVEEKKKEEPKKEEKKEEPKKVEYTCPDGYKLEGTKCTHTVAAKTKCPDKTYEYDGKCVTLTEAVRKQAEKTCGTKIINKGNGNTPSVQGELFQMGTYYCYYGKVTDTYENNQSNCTSRGHKWNSKNNTCYYDRDDANVNITSSCDHLSGHVYLANPNTYQGVNGLNGGCFPLTDKTSYCDTEGYTLSGSNCVKTIDATKK